MNRESVIKVKKGLKGFVISFGVFWICILNLGAQVECYDKSIATCEIDSSYQVYDYFNQRTDSLFCEYGRAILMDCTKYFFENKKPIFISRKTTYKDGSGVLDIFVDNKLLFSYKMKDDRIEGIGRIFNPKTGNVIYQAEFKNNLLNGHLFCISNSDSGVVHSMLFKEGKPIKILYVWSIKQTKKVYRKINKRKYFKGGVSTGIVSYPFN